MTMFTGADDGSGSTGRRQSVIDRDSHFSGTHSTPNDFRVEGHFDGTIECTGALIVAESADINAHVTAGSVSVAGHLQGDIGCRGRFEILPTGRVEARVQAVTIVVQEGARYEGEMRMRPEGGVERSEDATAAKRGDARPTRRPSQAGSSDVPSFSVSAGRANGRSVADDSSALPVPDRPGPSGQPASSDD
ncbi:MAG TPA: polymer-forming cytoskeletal protein [Dehalococcoidia bacterium]|nr:polymer-forming cytoskeletal protein [Dehalococcoidia bacterium]